MHEAKLAIFIRTVAHSKISGSWLIHDPTMLPIIECGVLAFVIATASFCQQDSDCIGAEGEIPHVVQPAFITSITAAPSNDPILNLPLALNDVNDGVAQYEFLVQFFLVAIHHTIYPELVLGSLGTGSRRAATHNIVINQCSERGRVSQRRW